LSTEGNANHKDNTAIASITFEITENMKKAGISEFKLVSSEFIFIFHEGAKRWISFSKKSDSLEDISKKIRKKLKNDLVKNFEEAAFRDLENQLIERRNEIFSIKEKSDSTKNNSKEDEYKSSYIARVSELRKQRTDSGFSYEQWQLSVQQKYDNLRRAINDNFTGAWPLLEFCLSVKTILNIDGCTLPFIGVLLDVPSSLKTLVIEMFRKYPHSFYSDSFTPNSLISHNSALTEEQLQKVDMIPKMRNKLVLIPEMASIFTAKDDDLRRVLGHTTRLADGHGLESDSGAQGHRKYGNTFFVWIGAAVEIPPRVWKLLGTLGHKIYFFRPFQTKTTDEELLEIAKSDNFPKKIEEVENVLYDYLISLEASFDGDITKISSDGITMIGWNSNLTDEQEDTLTWLTKLSRLLAHLRGSVYLSETRPFHVKNKEDGKKETDTETKASTISYIEELDYDNGIPIIEKPTRAVTLLRNLAIGHAFSQGRDSISSKDLPMIIRVVLSTTMIGRSKVFELLIEKDGELTTSTICNGLGISPPTAKRAMRELHALKLVEISTVAGYGSAELMITLRNEFEWIKTKEFKELWSKSNCQINPEIRYDNKNESYNQGSSQSGEKPANHQTKTEGKEVGEIFKDPCSKETESCDTDSRHASKANQPSDTQEKIFNESDGDSTDSNSASEDDNKKTAIELIDSEQLNSKEQNGQLSSGSSSKANKNGAFACDEKNNARLRESNHFQHVTPSRGHTESEIVKEKTGKEKRAVLELMLEAIKNANGSIVSVVDILNCVYTKNEIVRAYIGDKLTQRENRKIRQLYVDIIRSGNNIKVEKYKPQLLLRWKEPNQEIPLSNQQGKAKGHVGSDSN